MVAKRDWLTRHADHLRRALLLEPRGHADLCGALLTEPVLPGSHAGILFMHNGGYSAIRGHGVIAATTIALERGLIMPGGDGVTIVYDTPAGTVRALATMVGSGISATGAKSVRTGAVSRDLKALPVRVSSVSYSSVPSFVLLGGLRVAIGSRQIRADVAFGGEFYAIIDGESVAVPVEPSHLAELRRVGVEIAAAIEQSHAIVHPIDPGIRGVAGVVLTGPARASGADLRSLTVYADGTIDRSPCGAGTAAVMAVLEAMGLLSERKAFVHEGLIGTCVTGRIAGRTAVGDVQAIVPNIEGSAWITGEHAFLMHDDDPLKRGVRLSGVC